VEFAVMGGAMNVPGSQGLRATCMVTNFSRNESLEEAFPLSVTVKPTFYFPRSSMYFFSSLCLFIAV
jgi:hypothetical protein